MSVPLCFFLLTIVWLFLSDYSGLFSPDANNKQKITKNSAKLTKSISVFLANSILEFPISSWTRIMIYPSFTPDSNRLSQNNLNSR